MNTLKFQTTEQVRRYIQEIIDYWRYHEKQMPPDRIQFDAPALEIKTALAPEIMNNEAYRNISEFKDWLKLEKIITEEISTEGLENGYWSDPVGDERPEWAKTFAVQVRDIKPLLKIKSTYEQFDQDNNRLILLDEAGDVFYGKKREAVKMDKQKPYYKTFVAIYKATEGSGETTIGEVDKIYRRTFGTEKNIDSTTVQNHIHNSIKKVFSKKLPAGHKLFDWPEKGSGRLIFNNPELNYKK